MKNLFRKTKIKFVFFCLVLSITLSYTGWCMNTRTKEKTLMKLQEKKAVYAKEGFFVDYTEEPFAVVLLTPLMQRSHNLVTAKDIVFCDSTSSCDADQHTITFFLTACPAGATPLGVVITKGQSEQSYVAGFQLLKTALANNDHAFGHQGYPKVFLTDHSDAEINALKTVWPESTNLLCKFHILQAVWRWLCDSNNSIPSSERQSLMDCFKEILYASLTSVQSKYEAALSSSPNSNWSTYLQRYWSFKEKWIVAYRDHTIHGNHTNNFSEVSVRIFKDNILSRVKAYNVVALVDFCCSALEKFYCRKFQEFSNCRNASQRLLFEKLIRKYEGIEESAIVQLNEHKFVVPSATSPDVTYTVDTEIGACTYPQGIYGRFCKHEAAVYKYFNIQCVNFPAITDTHRYEMAVLATGSSTLTKSFYQPLVPSENINCEVQNSVFYHHEEAMEATTSASIEGNRAQTSSAQDEDQKLELMNKALELFRLKSLTFSSTSNINDLSKFIRRLDKVNTAGQWSTFLCTAGSDSVRLRRKSGACIGVQPTSIARRKSHLTRGSKKFPSGRPAKGSNTSLKVKRKHSLARNVRANLPNAK